MKRKILSILLSTILVTSLLGGCGSKNSETQNPDTSPANKTNESTTETTDGSTTETSGDKIVITFAEHLADVKTNAPQVYNIVQEFMKQNPNIVIDLQGAASDEHTLKMKLAAQTNTLPDIFYMIKGDAMEMAQAGYLADLSGDLLNDQSFLDNLLPGMIDVMNIEGAIYGLPAELFVNGIWYNKALFDKYGLELPTTFEELMHSAEVFNANGIVPMARGTKDVWSCWSTWTMHVRYGFYNHIDGIMNGTDKWNNPDFLKFYQKIQEMTEAGMFPENVSTMGYDEATQMFKGGQAAMFDSGAWDTAQFESSEYADSIGFWWGPTFSDGVGNQEVSMKAASHPYCVSAKTKEESPEKYEAVIKFLKFFYSKEGTQIIVDSNCVPVTYYDGQVDAEKYPVYANIMSALNDDWKSPQVCPNMYIGKFETTYFESIAGVINGIYTPEEAMDYLDEQSKIQGLIKE